MTLDPATLEQARRLGVTLSATGVPAPTIDRVRDQPRPRPSTPRPRRLSDGNPLPRSACLDCGRDAGGRPYCVPCAKVEVEFFAAVWGPLIQAGMMLNGGRIPQIDPALRGAA